MLWNKGKTKETDNRIKSAEKYSLEEVFIKDSPVTQKVLRGYVERHNIIEYKCQKCGCDGNWQNGIISLEIDHIDGNNTNNEISNLRYLCPNCHALTPTYRGKNKALKAQELNV
jgi:5-methylcytosine-specific restriction endonuclease McrA